MRVSAFHRRSAAAVVLTLGPGPAAAGSFSDLLVLSLWLVVWSVVLLLHLAIGREPLAHRFLAAASSILVVLLGILLLYALPVRGDLASFVAVVTVLAAPLLTWGAVLQWSRGRRQI